MERVAHLEKLVHDKDVQTLKDRQAKHEDDTKEMQATHYATVMERVAHLEKVVHDQP